MNLTRWIAPSICLLLLCLTHHVHAQTKVALVDIGAIFKSHPQFSAQLAQLKSQADRFKAEAQQTQQRLIQKAEALNQYEKESEEYRDAEANLAKESASLEVEQRGKMRELLKQEAQLHFDTYVEITNYVSQYCQKYGIQLVLRFNSEEMDQKNPRSIMQRVNGGVVYHSTQSDITARIAQRIAQSKRQAAGVGPAQR